MLNCKLSSIKKIKEHNDFISFEFTVNCLKTSFKILYNLHFENNRIRLEIEDKSQENEKKLQKYVSEIENTVNYFLQEIDKENEKNQKKHEDFFKLNNKNINITISDFLSDYEDLHIFFTQSIFDKIDSYLLHTKKLISFQKSILKTEEIFESSNYRSSSISFYNNPFYDDIKALYPTQPIVGIQCDFFKEDVSFLFMYITEIKDSFIVQRKEIRFFKDGFSTMKNDILKTSRYQNLINKISSIFPFDDFFNIVKIDKELLELKYKDVLDINYEENIFLILNKKTQNYSVFNNDDDITNFFLQKEIRYVDIEPLKAQ